MCRVSKTSLRLTGLIACSTCEKVILGNNQSLFYRYLTPFTKSVFNWPVCPEFRSIEFSYIDCSWCSFLAWTSFHYSRIGFSGIGQSFTVWHHSPASHWPHVWNFALVSGLKRLFVIKSHFTLKICLTSLTRAKCGTRWTLCWKILNISDSTELFAL